LRKKNSEIFSGRARLHRAPKIPANEFSSSLSNPHAQRLREQRTRGRRTRNRFPFIGRVRAERKNFHGRKKKFVDDFAHLHYATRQRNRVTTFINHSQKFHATRYRGLKGGIING
jgi:hypothetical protein